MSVQTQLLPVTELINQINMASNTSNPRNRPMRVPQISIGSLASASCAVKCPLVLATVRSITVPLPALDSWLTRSRIRAD